MKKSWKKALLAGLSIVMMGSFIAGCGSNNGADNKDVLKVGVTNFASTLEPTENFFAWVVMRYGVGETLAKFGLLPNGKYLQTIRHGLLLSMIR